MRQRGPAGSLIYAHRIKNSDPVQPPMTESLTQTFCRPAAESIAMAAHHGRSASVPQHQPLTPPLLHTNQVITKLKPNLRADHQQQQQQH